MSNKKDESSEDDEPDPDQGSGYHRSYGNESLEKAFKIRCNTLDDGTMAFIHWLSSTHKKSTIENPFVVKDFQKCTLIQKMEYRYVNIARQMIVLMLVSQYVWTNFMAEVKRWKALKLMQKLMVPQPLSTRITRQLRN